jgi:hypothetical protein
MKKSTVFSKRTREAIRHPRSSTSTFREKRFMPHTHKELQKGREKRREKKMGRRPEGSLRCSSLSYRSSYLLQLPQASGTLCLSHVRYAWITASTSRHARSHLRARLVSSQEEPFRQHTARPGIAEDSQPKSRADTGRFPCP